MNQLKGAVTKLAAIPYLFYFAKWVTRFAHFWKSTDPAGVTISVVVGIIGGIMGHTRLLFLNPEVSFNSYGWTAVVIGLKCAVFALTVLYLIWEVIQAAKWLTCWASDYKHEIINRRYEKETNQS
jgi:uncharacterized membrane protein YeaQ/YmgE (transglycosylase-associated protein family)